MALKDQSRRAFRQALKVFPAKVNFNGIAKDCVSQPITATKDMQLSGFVGTIGAQITMDEDDFAAFAAGGLEEKKSLVTLNGGEPLQYIQKQSHPNSAVVHLILSSQN